MGKANKKKKMKYISCHLKPWLKKKHGCNNSINILVNHSSPGYILSFGKSLLTWVYVEESFSEVLFSYLFILWLGLITLINYVERYVHGLKICRSTHHILHFILFVDNCFLFFRSEIHDVPLFKDILAT